MNNFFRLSLLLFFLSSMSIVHASFPPLRRAFVGGRWSSTGLAGLDHQVHLNSEDREDKVETNEAITPNNPVESHFRFRGGDDDPKKKVKVHNKRCRMPFASHAFCEH